MTYCQRRKNWIVVRSVRWRKTNDRSILQSKSRTFHVQVINALIGPPCWVHPPHSYHRSFVRTILLHSLLCFFPQLCLAEFEANFVNDNPSRCSSISTGHAASASVASSCSFFLFWRVNRAVGEKLRATPRETKKQAFDANFTNHAAARFLRKNVFKHPGGGDDFVVAYGDGTFPLSFFFQKKR